MIKGNNTTTLINVYNHDLCYLFLDAKENTRQITNNLWELLRQLKYMHYLRLWSKLPTPLCLWSKEEEEEEEVVVVFP